MDARRRGPRRAARARRPLRRAARRARLAAHAAAFPTATSTATRRTCACSAPRSRRSRTSTACTTRRNALMLKLEERGIATRQGTHAPVILDVYAERYGLRREQFPNAVIADRLTLALPLLPAADGRRPGACRHRACSCICVSASPHSSSIPTDTSASTSQPGEIANGDVLTGTLAGPLATVTRSEMGSHASRLPTTPVKPRRATRSASSGRSATRSTRRQ